jgi:hypothetical protein
MLNIARFMAIAIATPALAGPISGLTTFVPGTPATAADVNNNFTIIRNAGNDTDTRLINVEANRVLKGGDTMTGPLTVPTLTYAVPKVAFWSFHGRGFVHDTGNGFANCFPETLSWNGTGTSTFRAPVTLPHGATITGVTYNYWKSTSAGDNSTFALKRNNLPSSNASDPTTMASLTSSAVNHTSVTTNTITTPVVDNQNFNYFMVVTLGGTAGTHCVDGISIKYTYTTP